MATQLQIRRDTAADLASATPVEGEPIYDQTNNRLGVGDGTNTADAEALFALMNGDLHKMAPIYATAGGSADALTATLDPAPAAYAAGMTLIVKAASNNTGAATLNVNSLGAKTIKKNGGADDVEADDIVSGGIYILMYDGTNFQITGGVGGGGGSLYDSTQTPGAVSSVTFTGIPGTVNRLVISGAQISSTSSAVLQIRLGDSGGVESTGYESLAGTDVQNQASTTEFRCTASGASGSLNVVAILERVTGNRWALSANVDGAQSELNSVAGSKATSAALDRVQILWSAGNFDAGSITVRGYA